MTLNVLSEELILQAPFCGTGVAFPESKKASGGQEYSAIWSPMQQHLLFSIPASKDGSTLSLLF